MYLISIDAVRRLTRTTFTGFLEIEEMYRYADEHKAAVDQAFGDGDYAMMFDVSGCSIQSQQVMQAFEQWGNAIHSNRRIAVVTCGGIAAMQARRATHSTPTRVFETRQQALRWLSAGQGPL